MKQKKGSMGSRLDLVDLAKHLRQEHLFVQSERQHIQMLNDRVLKTVESLYHIAWIAKQQRINLESLILTSVDSHPAACCQRANTLENVSFIDSYKQLGVHDTIYAEFLQQFRDDPKLIALSLDAGEKLSIESMHSMVPIILSSIYGNCVLPEDESYVLQLLRELMSLQLATSDNPRRLLRHGSCAFSRTYKAFTEGLFSAKLFLTAALHDPIMHLLMEDDLFLDIDPGKAAVRFMPQERLRHFGREGTPEYSVNLQKYRNMTIGRLVSLTNRFISSIRSNLYCFPQSLSWLVRQMYNSLMRAKRVEVREVGAMCADLVFAFFVCPAIVNPEPYGITDAPISHIARFNLMQVAQILQVLAMTKCEEFDPKLLDLYGRFPKDCMSSLLDLILEGSAEDSPNTLTSQLFEMTRFAVLITESELRGLIQFLRNVQNNWQDEMLQKTLSSVLGNLHLAVSQKSPQNENTPNSTPCGTPPHTPVTKRHLLGKVSRRSLKATVSHPATDDDPQSNHTEGDTSQCSQKVEEVLVIPLNNAEFECPGMWSEEKVLTIEQQQKQNRVRMNLDNLVNEEVESVTSGPETVEKRTRFSLSQDQESIGTSDNLEAISEAASNHSVASSLDLENENENDNLSDMVSANVSGRGTPNVSGRDTPSSQLEGEEQRPLDLPPVVISRKQNQADMDDKFGRFEINPLIEGDETKSMVSDTWSTDVLASDSETVEQSENALHVIVEPQTPGMLLDISETASQSDAWSTDVMPSDTERLQELDTDDTASVARSDDTTRSEIEADGTIESLRAEQGDVLDEMEFVNPVPSGSPGFAEQFQYRYPALRRGSQEGSAFREVRRSSQGLLPDSQEFRSVVAPPEVQITVSNIAATVQDNGIHISTSSSTKAVFQRDEQVILNPLSVEVENTPEVIANMSATEDLTPTGNSPHHVLLSPTNADRTSQDGSLTDVQSLGRLSLAMRELPETGNLKCAAFLLDSLQDLASGSEAAGNSSAHRSSVADLLNLDLTKALPQQQQQQPQPFRDDLIGKSGSRHSLSELVRGPGKRRGTASSFSVQHQQQEETTRLSSTSMSSSSSSCSGGPDLPGSEGPKGNPSTGAIPKSISFDKTADKACRELEGDDRNDDRNRKSFFKLTNLKFAFKGRNRKSRPGVDGYVESVKDKLHVSSSFRRMQRNFSEDAVTSNTAYADTTEEILAKYRKKQQPDRSEPEPPTTPLDGPVDDDSQVFEASSESTFAFADAKRKLRLVLGSSDIQTLPWLRGANTACLQYCTNGPKGTGNRENELVAFLRVLLAEAINLQQRQLVAHLHEALRCVRVFDDTECQKLLRSLKRDYRKRAPYIAYLVRCRQGLLSTLAHLETLVERINRDKQVCSKYLISMCVRMFLEKEERSIRMFVDKFQALTVSDEKAQLVEKYMAHLFGVMESDPMWQTASELQLEDAQTVVERTIMSKIYIYALYPNGDGDMLRDQVLHQHMEKLSQVITPSHKDLRIPKMYHHECPWPSAQAEIITINAYKTPSDKIQCVVRCCSTIMNLLSMASSKSVPAADDFMPVLVYVLVKANPPSLLSTVQYVHTLHEKHLEGEEAYWWTQFSSAIEFIKTMDY